MKENSIQTFKVKETIKEPNILCDGCYEEKEKVTPYLLKDIITKVNLCDDCLKVFTELEKEESIND